MNVQVDRSTSNSIALHIQDLARFSTVAVRVAIADNSRRSGWRSSGTVKYDIARCNKFGGTVLFILRSRCLARTYSLFT